MIELRNSINSKEIPEDENPKKVVDIVENFFDFNKQQKGKRRLLNLGCEAGVSDRKLQRLSIALAQVKACNTSENLLNEIRHIICSLYRAKEITKKVYNNVMNSINL